MDQLFCVCGSLPVFILLSAWRLAGVSFALSFVYVCVRSGEGRGREKRVGGMHIQDIRMCSF